MAAISGTINLKRGCAATMSKLTELNLVVSTLVQDLRTLAGGSPERDKLRELFKDAADALHKEIKQVSETSKEVRAEPSNDSPVRKSKKKE